MSTAQPIHTDHQHGEGCGHVAFPHGDHTDYAHEGHIDREDADGWQECTISGHAVVQGEHGHTHGEGCGHVAVPHDDHVDYLHDGGRHAAHEGHYDDH